MRIYMRERFGVKQPQATLHLLPKFVWRRIYSFDLSDAIEVAYRRDHNRRQRCITVEPDTPITRLSEAGRTLELVKLSGDGLSDLIPNTFTKPSFRSNVSASKRYNGLRLDFEIHPVIILGSESDRNFLFNEFRALRRTEAQQQTVFICPGMKSHQIEMLSQQSGIYFDIDGQDFLNSLSDVFPDGRSLDDISQTMSGLVFDNKELRDIVLDSFTALTTEKFEEYNVDSSVEGGIHSFYKGSNVEWSNIIQGIHADLVPFRNFRNRIANELDKKFPSNKLFLLQSPAGMGKTVGLLAAAYWLRQRTTVPILWLEPDGDLRGFLKKLRVSDFPSGTFLFIDNITNHIEAFSDIHPEKFNCLSFVCSSRETRWKKYKRRLPADISVVEENMRKLNRLDAEELHFKISRYGTTVHFNSNNKDDQIKEILDRSKKDMLVLIRELGQGKKFDAIVKSEISELGKEQKLAYLLIAITDRNQIPLPIDLFGHAFRYQCPDADMSSTLEDLGRIIGMTANRRVLRTRHSIIAEHVIEKRNAVFEREEVQEAVRALISAFSNYRIPIIVHHSNTGHARVFKAIMNNRFLSEVLGFEPALKLYQEFEKIFEQDGFFWQQYGLCESRAGRYEDAISTLRHAYAVHDHFQIKHSLGAACLTACAKLGPDGLVDNEFSSLRIEGREVLSELHEEAGYKDDMPIATLAEIDTKISGRFDKIDEFHSLCKNYHIKLAIYIRDNPKMLDARRTYEKLNRLLLNKIPLIDPDYESLLDSDNLIISSTN